MVQSFLICHIPVVSLPSDSLPLLLALYHTALSPQNPSLLPSYLLHTNQVQDYASAPPNVNVIFSLTVYLCCVHSPLPPSLPASQHVTRSYHRLPIVISFSASQGVCGTKRPQARNTA